MSLKSTGLVIQETGQEAIERVFDNACCLSRDYDIPLSDFAAQPCYLELFHPAGEPLLKVSRPLDNHLYCLVSALNADSRGLGKRCEPGGSTRGLEEQASAGSTPINFRILEHIEQGRAIAKSFLEHTRQSIGSFGEVAREVTMSAASFRGVCVALDCLLQEITLHNRSGDLVRALVSSDFRTWLYEHEKTMQTENQITQGVVEKLGALMNYSFPPFTGFHRLSASTDFFCDF